MSPLRYRSLSSWLKERFSGPVRKITIDSGLGCPNRDGTLGVGGCIFCNSRGSGTNAGSRGLSVTDQVDQGIEFFSRRYKVRKFIAYFQSFTNTYGNPKLLERLYHLAIQRPEIVGLSIGTRPDCVSDDVMDILSDINKDKPVWLELGLQSIHNRTLKLIRRGHESGIFFKTADRALKRDLLVAAHIILGLPGETIEDTALTAKAVGKLGDPGYKGTSPLCDCRDHSGGHVQKGRIYSYDHGTGHRGRHSRLGGLTQEHDHPQTDFGPPPRGTGRTSAGC